ncbi:MAG TPA: choice-of-anchor Q domain-containing protein [Terriglobales bacterium]|nr:choice-of-anchor Q domain-containing protein [Terriglobales bacterium]
MKLTLSSLLLAFCLATIPSAVASTKWYVNGVTGSDSNNCLSPTTACKTIGYAISLASSGDSIMVASATYTENLTISISLEILGAHASTTIVDGGGGGTVVTISGTTPNVTLSKLTIQHGYGQYGGGVNNNGTLTMSNVTVANNATSIPFGWGGGIYNSAVLTVNNSTISGNVAHYFCLFGCTGGQGGGIYNARTLMIANSTVAGNAGAEGGSIYNAVGGTLTINSTTLSGNGFINLYNYYGSATLENSIVASATSGGNCSGTSTMTSEGYNLSDDTTCNFNGPGDLNNTDPKLGTLGNYGGPTQTIPEMPDSPTIDAGNPSGCTDSQGHPLKTDQRGYPRPGAHKHDKRCDMGAYESQTD